MSRYITKPCVVCGKPIEQAQSSPRQRKTCGDKCYLIQQARFFEAYYAAHRETIQAAQAAIRTRRVFQ